MVRITICICTYRRVQSLQRCLYSLSGIDAVSSATVLVLVVDNDTSCGAKSSVMQLQSTFPYSLKYVCEHNRGIPCARNRAIDEAIKQSSDYLIFVDDDEWVEKDWLKNMLDFCYENDGQVVVHGKVIPELPKDTPISISCLFGAKNHPTGTALASCATDNVLIPAKVFRDMGVRFDESFPLAGGTDTRYFVEVVANGVDILQCEEAIVHEEISKDRANLRWLSRRKYRAGITEAWKKRRRGRGRLGVLATMFVRMIIDTLMLIFFLGIGSSSKRNQIWLKLCKSVGVCAGVCGARVDSYKVIVQ